MEKSTAGSGGQKKKKKRKVPKVPSGLPTASGAPEVPPRRGALLASGPASTKRKKDKTRKAAQDALSPPLPQHELSPGEESATAEGTIRAEAVRQAEAEGGERVAVEEGEVARQATVDQPITVQKLDVQLKAFIEVQGQTHMNTMGDFQKMVKSMKKVAESIDPAMNQKLEEANKIHEAKVTTDLSNLAVILELKSISRGEQEFSDDIKDFIQGNGGKGVTKENFKEKAGSLVSILVEKLNQEFEQNQSWVQGFCNIQLDIAQSLATLKEDKETSEQQQAELSQEQSEISQKQIEIAKTSAQLKQMVEQTQDSFESTVKIVEKFQEALDKKMTKDEVKEELAKELATVIEDQNALTEKMEEQDKKIQGQIALTQANQAEIKTLKDSLDTLKQATAGNPEINQTVTALSDRIQGLEQEWNDRLREITEAQGGQGEQQTAQAEIFTAELTVLREQIQHGKEESKESLEKIKTEIIPKLIQDAFSDSGTLNSLISEKLEGKLRELKAGFTDQESSLAEMKESIEEICSISGKLEEMEGLPGLVEEMKQLLEKREVIKRENSSSGYNEDLVNGVIECIDGLDNDKIILATQLPVILVENTLDAVTGTHTGSARGGGGQVGGAGDDDKVQILGEARAVVKCLTDHLHAVDRRVEERLISEKQMKQISDKCNQLGLTTGYLHPSVIERETNDDNADRYPQYLSKLSANATAELEADYNIVESQALITEIESWASEQPNPAIINKILEPYKRTVKQYEKEKYLRDLEVFLNVAERDIIFSDTVDKDAMKNHIIAVLTGKENLYKNPNPSFSGGGYPIQKGGAYTGGGGPPATIPMFVELFRMCYISAYLNFFSVMINEYKVEGKLRFRKWRRADFADVSSPLREGGWPRLQFSPPEMSSTTKGRYASDPEGSIWLRFTQKKLNDFAIESGILSALWGGEVEMSGILKGVYAEIMSDDFIWPDQQNKNQHRALIVNLYGIYMTVESYLKIITDSCAEGEGVAVRATGRHGLGDDATGEQWRKGIMLYLCRANEKCYNDYIAENPEIDITALYKVLDGRDPYDFNLSDFFREVMSYPPTDSNPLVEDSKRHGTNIPAVNKHLSNLSHFHSWFLDNYKRVGTGEELHGTPSIVSELMHHLGINLGEEETPIVAHNPLIAGEYLYWRSSVILPKKQLKKSTEYLKTQTRQLRGNLNRTKMAPMAPAGANVNTRGNLPLRSSSWPAGASSKFGTRYQAQVVDTRKILDTARTMTPGPGSRVNLGELLEKFFGEDGEITQRLDELERYCHRAHELHEETHTETEDLRGKLAELTELVEGDYNAARGRDAALGGRIDNIKDETIQAVDERIGELEETLAQAREDLRVEIHESQEELGAEIDEINREKDDIMVLLQEFGKSHAMHFDRCRAMEESIAAIERGSTTVLDPGAIDLSQMQSHIDSHAEQFASQALASIMSGGGLLEVGGGDIFGVPKEQKAVRKALKKAKKAADNVEKEEEEHDISHRRAVEVALAGANAEAEAGARERTWYGRKTKAEKMRRADVRQAKAQAKLVEAHVVRAQREPAEIATLKHTVDTIRKETAAATASLNGKATKRNLERTRADLKKLTKELQGITTSGGEAKLDIEHLKETCDGLKGGNAELNTKIDKFNGTVNRKMKEGEARLTELIKAGQQDLEGEMADFKSHLKATETKLEAQISSDRQDYEAKLREMKEQLRVQEAKLKDALVLESRDRKAELARLNQEMALTNQRHTSDLQMMKTDNDAKIKHLETALSASQESYDTKLSSLEQKLSAEIELQSQYLTGQFKDGIQGAKDEISQQIAHSEGKLKDEFNQALAQIDIRVSGSAKSSDLVRLGLELKEEMQRVDVKVADCMTSEDFEAFKARYEAQMKEELVGMKENQMRDQIAFRDKLEELRGTVAESNTKIETKLVEFEQRVNTKVDDAVTQINGQILDQKTGFDATLVHLEADMQLAAQMLGTQIRKEFTDAISSLSDEIRPYIEEKYQQLELQLKDLDAEDKRQAIESVQTKMAIETIQSQLNAMAGGAIADTSQLIMKIDALGDISSHSDQIMTMLQDYETTKAEVGITKDTIVKNLEEIQEIREELMGKLRQSRSINLSVSSIDSQELLVDKLAGDHRGVIVRYLFSTNLQPIWGNVNSADIKELKETTMAN